MTDYLEKLREREVPSPHWHLQWLGVEPERQGQGIGSAILQQGLLVADADGLPCYLQNSNERNLSFYRRHGFEVAGVHLVPDGGPSFWTMKREPRR